MSAPDHNDPNAKLKLTVRPMRASGSIFAIASGIGVLGVCISLVGFLASLWPGVTLSGKRFWFLLGVVVFGVAAAFFNWLRKLLRRSS